MKTILKVSLLFLFVTVSCSKNDDSDDNDLQTNDKFFAQVNGDRFISGDPFIGASYNASSGASAFAIVATALENNNFAKAIGITFVSTDNEFEFRSGLVLTHNDEDLFLSGVYTETGSEEYDFVENTSMRLEFTKVDTSEKLVSGKFSFVEIVEDNSNNEKTYNVTNGEFTNLSYTED